jgi:hypothetical protein
MSTRRLAAILAAKVVGFSSPERGGSCVNYQSINELGLVRPQGSTPALDAAL